MFVFHVSVTVCRGLVIFCASQNLKTSVFRWVCTTSPGALCRISSSVAGLISGERTSATPRSVLQISDRHLRRYPIHSGFLPGSSAASSETKLSHDRDNVYFLLRRATGDCACIYVNSVCRYKKKKELKKCEVIKTVCEPILLCLCMCVGVNDAKTRGETNRSNIRIKVFVHRCSNFVSLFELFVPLAHAQNNLRSKKKPVLAMDESSASSSSVRKHFEKNKGAGTVTCKLCQNRLKWNRRTTSSFGTTSKGNTPLRLQVKLCCQHGAPIYTVAYTYFSFRLWWAKAW